MYDSDQKGLGHLEDTYQNHFPLHIVIVATKMHVEVV